MAAASSVGSDDEFDDDFEMAESPIPEPSSDDDDDWYVMRTPSILNRFRNMLHQKSTVEEEPVDDKAELRSLVERIVANKDDQLVVVMKREEGMVTKLRLKNRQLKEALAEAGREIDKLKVDLQERADAHAEVAMLLKASQLQVAALRSIAKGPELKAIEEDMNKTEHFDKMLHYYEKKYKEAAAKLSSMQNDQNKKLAPIYAKVKELSEESRDLLTSSRDAISWALDHLKQDVEMAFLEADPASWAPQTECEEPHCSEATVEELEKAVINLQRICMKLMQTVGVEDDDTFMQFPPDGQGDTRIDMQIWQVKLVGQAVGNLQFHVRNKFKEIQGLTQNSAAEELEELKSENARLKEEILSLQEESNEYRALKPQYQTLELEFAKYRDEQEIKLQQLELELMKQKSRPEKPASPPPPRKREMKDASTSTDRIERKNAATKTEEPSVHIEQVTSTTFLTEQEEDWAYCYKCKPDFPKHCKGCNAALSYGPGVDAAATAVVVSKLAEMSKDIEEEKAEMNQMLLDVTSRFQAAAEQAAKKRRKGLPADQAAVEALMAWKKKRQAALERRERLLKEFYIVLKTSILPLMENLEVRGLSPKSSSREIVESRVPLPPRDSAIRLGSAPRPAPIIQNDAPPLHESLSFRSIAKSSPNHPSGPNISPRKSFPDTPTQLPSTAPSPARTAGHLSPPGRLHRPSHIDALIDSSSAASHQLSQFSSLQQQRQQQQQTLSPPMPQPQQPELQERPQHPAFGDHRRLQPPAPAYQRRQHTAPQHHFPGLLGMGQVEQVRNNLRASVMPFSKVRGGFQLGDLQVGWSGAEAVGRGYHHQMRGPVPSRSPRREPALGSRGHRGNTPSPERLMLTGFSSTRPTGTGRLSHVPR